MAQGIELILARRLAEAVAAPALLIDARGDTLYYNEPAEDIFGRRFDEVDALPFEERTRVIAPLQVDGRPLALEDLPGVRAMRDRRPAHEVFYIHGLDGLLRPIQATAIPIESAHGVVLGALIWLWMDGTVGPEGGTPPR